MEFAPKIKHNTSFMVDRQHVIQCYQPENHQKVLCIESAGPGGGRAVA